MLRCICTNFFLHEVGCVKVSSATRVQCIYTCHLHEWPFFNRSHAGCSASYLSHFIGFNLYPLMNFHELLCLGGCHNATQQQFLWSSVFPHPHNTTCLHIMAPIVSYQTLVQTETKGKPQSLFEGTGLYGATLKQGLLPKPLIHTQKPVPAISITKSKIEIKASVDTSVVGESVQNEGMIEFETENDEVTIINPTDDTNVSKASEPVPDAAPDATITKSVVGCEIKTGGIKFGRRRV
ncbi:hypothetical protein F4860DRAFT_463769 [Xylaria cubensis]|nr:hypothetical protein F4860DRAFT_463769 [Xylaria cubensis]